MAALLSALAALGFPSFVQAAQGSAAEPQELTALAGQETRFTLTQAPRSTLDARAALAAANAIAAQIGGAEVYSVAATGSMRPLFSERAFLVTEPAAFEDLQVGDIVTFWHPKLKTCVVHRILEKRDGGYWTKGDHNSKPDNVLVTTANYRKRVCAIIYARESSVAQNGAGLQAARVRS